MFGDEVGRRIGSIKTAWQLAVLACQRREAGVARGQAADHRVCRQRLREINLHFHDLRHEAAPAPEGRPIHHVKEILGHANISTTDTYLNVTRLGLRESMHRFEAGRQTCTTVAQTALSEVSRSPPTLRPKPKCPTGLGLNLAGSTGLEPAASGVTGRRSSQLNYDPVSRPTARRVPRTTLVHATRTRRPHRPPNAPAGLPGRSATPASCGEREGWWAVQGSNL